MNPYKLLKKLVLGDPAPSIGEVLQVEGNSVRVMTAAGVLTYQKNALVLSQGDQVRIEGGVIKGRIKKAGQIPVYTV